MTEYFVVITVQHGMKILTLSEVLVCRSVAEAYQEILEKACQAAGFGKNSVAVLCFTAQENVPGER